MKLLIGQLTEKVDEIKKNIRTWGWGHLVFKLERFQEGGSEFLLSIRQISCLKTLCQIVVNVGVKRFHIVAHSYAASFSTKTGFCETKNIF